MKKFNLSDQLPRVILSIIIGVLLVTFPEEFQNSIIYLIGGIITLLGVIKLIIHFVKKPKVEGVTFPINAILYLIMGLIVIIKASYFLEILMLLLGFILIIISLGQIMMYFALRKSTVVLPLYMYIFPAITFIAGAISIYNPFQAAQTLIVFFGYVMLFYAVSELVSMYMTRETKI